MTLIGRPKEIYGKLPASKLEAIEKRDKRVIRGRHARWRTEEEKAPFGSLGPLRAVDCEASAAVSSSSSTARYLVCQMCARALSSLVRGRPTHDGVRPHLGTGLHAVVAKTWLAKPVR